MQSSNSTRRWLTAFTGAAIILMALATSTPVAGAQRRNSTDATNATSQIKTPVDVNSADQNTLETLPGIGPVLAKRIVEGRPYKNLDDLGRVKGLNKAKLAALKDDVTFGPAATAKQGKTSKTTRTAKARPSQNTNAQTTPLTPTGRSTEKLAPGEKININTATAEELDRLPGIGPAKAQAIIDYRNQNGKFQTIEDIEKVKGIKEGEFSKLKDNIKVNE